MCVCVLLYTHAHVWLLVCFLLKVIFAGVGLGGYYCYSQLPKYLDDVDRSLLLRMSWIYNDVDICGGLG